MMIIRNNEDLKIAYELLHIFENALRNGGFGNVERAEQEIIDLKRSIREYVKPADTGRRIIKDFDDGYIELIECPEEVDCPTSAYHYFTENIFMRYRPSTYDCTGQLFTSWYHIGRLHGRMVLHHCVCADV